jgi:hypothetical protein
VSLHDFTCRETCPHYHKPWPAHLPVPTCRLLTEYEAGIENPVTRASYRSSIRARTERKECGNDRP